MVDHLRVRFGVSQRWVCRVVGQHRSTQRRPSVVRNDDSHTKEGLDCSKDEVLRLVAFAGLGTGRHNPAGARMSDVRFLTFMAPFGFGRTALSSCPEFLLKTR